MALTPGRPHEATIHPRTRPEANEYALRNRGTSDWYRHDGKNIEEMSPPPVRLAGKNAEDIAEKSKGEPDQWFQHNSNNPPDDQPVPRIPTEEAKEAQEKIYGKEEHWVKHEDNQEYYSPKGQQRLPEFGPSITFKEKFTKPTSMEWYRHDEGPNPRPSDELPQKSKSKTKSPSKAPQPTSGTWFSHDMKNGTNVSDSRAISRTSNNPDAEGYLARNRQGSATSWFGHDSSKAELAGAASPRVTSQEGSNIAKKLGRESENWYSHDANKDYRDSQPCRKGSEASQHMVERARGGDMAQTLKMEAASSPAPDSRVRPEARETAEKSRQGLMDKYLQSNKDYNSPRPEPRVKPEAVESAEKSKGAMGDFMQGYPAPAEKKDGPRIRPEAQVNAERNQGSFNKVIGGDPPSSRAADGGRAVKSEAQNNAQRNKGTLSNLMENYGNMNVSDRPAPRLQNDAARQNAARNQGINNLIM